MNFIIVQIGDVTENKNRIVKMRCLIESEVGSTGGGTYYLPVVADSLKKAVGDTVNLDLDNFDITERPFSLPDSGEEVMLKWLSPKKR